MKSSVEQIVTGAEELAEVCRHLSTVGRFGFDTEFVGEDSYRPELCLIQAATEERLILIDPYSVGPLDRFWEMVVDPRIEVIVHAGREEMRLCTQWTGRRPQNFFDLQIAAGLAGFPYPLGHGALVQQTLGLRLQKMETRTEWRDRPLTPAQLSYAFDDVRHLLVIADRLRSRLIELNRLEWLHEEMERLAALAAPIEAPGCQTGQATDAPGTAGGAADPAVERWRRLRGLGALTRRQLAVVREVYFWREATAARVNRPLRICCRDDLIVEIARRMPQTEKDLKVIRGLNRFDWPGLLAAVERGRTRPAGECPRPIEREPDPPRVALLTRFLSAVAGHLATSMQIAPDLLCTAADIRAMVRKHLWPDADGVGSVLDLGWRRAYVRPHLERVLTGEVAVRVAQPHSDAPFDVNPSALP